MSQAGPGTGPPQDPVGRVSVTGPGPLVVLGLAGLLVGWAGRRQALGSDWPRLDVGWLTIGAIWFVAAITLGIAFLTRRAVQAERVGLPPRQGLSRLVLGKTIARVAAATLGLCLGVVISRIGVASDAASTDIVLALLAGLGAAVGVAAGLLLEHACRVPPGDSFDLP
ncbi:hypothetical protein ABIE44_001393 [Marmoricola sp. OAE513]|uniref:DUF3180 family protein n=1 Tax=Marmoricola sp. OAE513 TaxID=2817894 RepID=UPI001AE33484